MTAPAPFIARLALFWDRFTFTFDLWREIGYDGKPTTLRDAARIADPWGRDEARHRRVVAEVVAALPNREPVPCERKEGVS